MGFTVIGSDLDFLPEIPKIVVDGISKIHGQLGDRDL